MSSTETVHAPVLIIRGGIVGLSAALFLAHHSIPTLLAERRSGTSTHPRARSVNSRTMELYRSINIADTVREAGASLAPSIGILSGDSVTEIPLKITPRTKSTILFIF